MHEMRLFAVALQFLTRVPVPSFREFDPQWLNDCARHFSTVGVVVAAASGAVLWLASLWWPVPLAAVIALASALIMTGAFHEDGLADTWDALGGAVSRERALEIMKDSRLGTYGTAALVVVLAVKALALTTIATHALAHALWALVVVHAASRAGSVAVMRVLPYGGDEAHAKAKPLARPVGALALVVSLLVSLVVAAAAVFAGMPGSAVVLTLCACAVASALTARWLSRRLSGFTGDGLGATQQHAEMAGLLAWAAAVG